MDFEFSPNVVMFQANSDAICQRFNKTITLPTVLLSCVFNFYITFCKYPCFSLIHSFPVHSRSFPVLRDFLTRKPPKAARSLWVGRTWAVARRFVPLANRRAGKTIAIVFQIRLQLVRAKSVFQFPDRT